jgi:hypothetical protein
MRWNDDNTLRRETWTPPHTEGVTGNNKWINACSVLRLQRHGSRGTKTGETGDARDCWCGSHLLGGVGLSSRRIRIGLKCKFTNLRLVGCVPSCSVFEFCRDMEALNDQITITCSVFTAVDLQEVFVIRVDTNLHVRWPINHAVRSRAANFPTDRREKYWDMFWLGGKMYT